MAARATATTPDYGPETADQVLQPLIGVCIAFIVVETTFVALRFVARTQVKKTELGWDDYLLIPAYIINIGLCALGLIMAHYEKIGNPPARAPISAPDQLETQLFPVLKIIFAIELMLTPAYTIPKLAVLCLYLRIFEIRWMRICSWSLISLLCVIMVIWALVAIFQCHPVNYFWDRLIPGTCIDINAFYRSFNPPNIFTDVLILTLPLPVVWRLQTSNAKKVGLTVIFMAGSVGLIASCIRFSYFLRYTSEIIVPYTTAPLISWTIVEPGMYFIAACSPALRPVFLLITPRAVASWFGTASRGAAPSTPARQNRPAIVKSLNSSTAAEFTRLADAELGLTETYIASSGHGHGTPLQDLGEHHIHVKTDVSVSGMPRTKP